VDEKTWNQTAGGGKIGNPKKTEREDGQCSARFVLSFRKGFETRNERQTSKNRSDSKPQKSRLFSALRGLKNGVHLKAAIRQPDRREPGRPPREVVNRVYSDTVTGETMLLRAVIEETESEIAVITLYKTSKLKKYLPEETT
jgi:hypothetical protein